MNMFTTVSFNYHLNFGQIHNMSDGILEEDHDEFLSKYGPCTMQIIIKSWYKLLFEEVLNAFYFFQVFCVIIWACNFFYRSCLILGTLAFTAVCTELYDTIKNLQRLSEMAYYECPITVRRINHAGEIVYKTVNSDQIVPGDVIVVPEGLKIPCDAILLHGECVMNEAMLTGESIPAIKSALPHDDTSMVEDFSIENKDQCRHFLFSGTEVVQNRKGGEIGVIALVTRTSFSTTKGGLIRSIMYSMPTRFDFYRDVYKILAVSMTIGIVCIGVILPTYIQNYSVYHIVTRSAGTYTICIPAILPIVMIMGIMFGLNRLHELDIYCTSPMKINTAGRVSTMVFDKTGTLTNEGLNAVAHKIKCASNMEINDSVWETKENYLQS